MKRKTKPLLFVLCVVIGVGAVLSQTTYSIWASHVTVEIEDTTNPADPTDTVQLRFRADILNIGYQNQSIVSNALRFIPDGLDEIAWAIYTFEKPKLAPRYSKQEAIVGYGDILRDGRTDEEILETIREMKIDITYRSSKADSGSGTTRLPMGGAVLYP